MPLSTLLAAGAASLAAAPVVVSRNLALKKLDYKVPLQVGLLAATQLVLSLSFSVSQRGLHSLSSFSCKSYSKTHEVWFLV
jgi:hypothetical protein